MTRAYRQKKTAPAVLAAGMTTLSVAAFLALPALAGAAVTSTVAADAAGNRGKTTAALKLLQR